MIGLKSYIFLFVVLYNHSAHGDEFIKLEISQGILVGKVLKSRNNLDYYAFLSIPYAKADRFEPPQDPEEWGIIERDATIDPPRCAQVNALSKNFEMIGIETCLYLNVFTPAVKDTLLPVMVYIHGGNFINGAGILYPPDYILDNPVVLVTMNFRLGVFGFTSTADNILPGNLGLKDQVAALKWIKNNIVKFGGNPESITLFGENSGGSSVGLHLYSPLSTELFHRAIMQSGTALSYWVHVPPKIARRKAFTLGILNGCFEITAENLIKCLKRISAEKLLRAHQKFYVWEEEPLPFPVVIEDIDVKDAFITQNPWLYPPINDVPVIIGITSGEGAFKAYPYLSNNGELAADLNQNYRLYFPVLYHYSYWLIEEHRDIVTEKLKTFYFGNKPIDRSTSKELVDINTDAYFAYSSIETAIRYPKLVYFYYYDHRNKHTTGELLGDYREDLGVCHGDDVLSLFPFIPSIFSKITEGPDLAVSQRMVNYWYNFANYGNPNGNGDLWQPVTSNNFEYLHITTAEDKMKINLLKDRYLFWSRLGADPFFESEIEN